MGFRTLALAAMLCALAPMSWGRVAVKTIDFPGAIATEAMSINDRGDVVGFYTQSDATMHGFLFSQGAYSSIDFPGATLTGAMGINNNGQIVGFYSAGSFVQGFYFDGISYTTLQFPGATLSIANGINNFGDVVGYYKTTGIVRHGFEWSSGVFRHIDPNGTNDVVVPAIKYLGNM